MPHRPSSAAASSTFALCRSARSSGSPSRRSAVPTIRSRYPLLTVPARHASNPPRFGAWPAAHRSGRKYSSPPRRRRRGRGGQSGPPAPSPKAVLMDAEAGTGGYRREEYKADEMNHSTHELLQDLGEAETGEQVLF